MAGEAKSAPDDMLLEFRTDLSHAAGQLVRLGPALDQILRAHDYPDSVSVLLGEALSLTALLGAKLKDGGRLILQTRSDGPVSLVVAHYDAPGRMRGYASFDAEKIAALEKQGDDVGTRLLGDGQLAMTIDPGGEQVSHQGIVELVDGSLTESAHEYFRRSEQLPTFIRLAVARQYLGGQGERAPAWHWRSAGIIVQRVPRLGGDPKPGETPEERDMRLHGEDEEDWTRVAMLAATVEAHELIDPTLAPERLLWRLFNEEGVRAGAAMPLEAKCRCSRQRVEGFLKTFTAEELADMRETDGRITVTCEFCSTHYKFEPGELG
ncbi:MAG: Hsp33 family molecular chaperone [Hyphomicrobiaceae bacterium]